VAEHRVRNPLSPEHLRGTVRMGLKSLWNHRLRSLLTALGIVSGVCSVISMLAIGEGASFEAQEQIRKLGSNNIIIRSIKPPEEKSSTAENSRLAEYGITYDDVARIEETVPGIRTKVPARIVRRDIWRGGRRVDCDIYGTVPAYTTVHNHRVARGRFFTQAEYARHAKVCVLSEGMAGQLFPLDSPIGRRVHAGTRYYTVVGIMAPKGTAAVEGSVGGETEQGGSYRLFVPLTTLRGQFGEIIVEQSSGSRTFERVELHEVTLQVEETDKVLQTFESIRGALELGHKKTDYTITVPLELLRNAERTKQIFNIVLGGIAALSLLVGGIGIMNIMLASVTERTREIGIRRALGARKIDITVQFLVETVLLSCMGGLIGVALGIAIPYFVEIFAGMPTIVTLSSPVMASSAFTRPCAPPTWIP